MRPPRHVRIEFFAPWSLSDPFDPVRPQGKYLGAMTGTFSELEILAHRARATMHGEWTTVVEDPAP